jgi:hypothetical protein
MGYRNFALFAYSWFTTGYTTIWKENTMGLSTDLTNATNAIEAELAGLSGDAATILDRITTLTAQLATIRAAIATIAQADNLADQLAEAL